MSRELEKIRNIGVIAHIDAGKTTVTEHMLFYSNYVHRAGMVDSGTTVTDFDPEERERGITIRAACVTFNWRDCCFNLIDTPGHVDFTAEVERSLRVLDGGIVIFSAREGVEAQSETVWRQADKYHVPRIAFINKMDREGADFYGTVLEIEKRLGAKPIIISIPVGQGPPHVPEAFRGTIDLIAMKQLTYTNTKTGGEVHTADIDADMLEEAQHYREKLLDDLSLYSDELTELLLAQETISEEMIRGVLREATLSDMAVPVLCGSALDGLGVQPVMDAVCYYLPSPADVPDVQGRDPSRPDDPETQRAPDPKAPFCGLVFKVKADKHGDLFFLRVYSGTLKANSRILNPRENKKENVPQLWRIQADHREQIQEVEAGDICGVIGLHFSVTGDTLCDLKYPIVLEQISFPETVISMAIEPESADEHKKLTGVLDLMRRQDPTFRATINEETGQTLISGMGELHLEVIKNELLREHKVKVRVHHPRVSYRESIQKAVEVEGTCQRTLGGTRHFAKIQMRMEPVLSDSQAVEIAYDCNDEAFKPEYKNIVLESLREESQGGGQLGYPLISVRMVVTGGEFSDTETTEVALRIAASDVYRKGLEAAGIVLLEPIMKLEVVTPDEYVGDIVGDLNQRRGVVTQTHNRGKLTVIESETPLSNLFGYSSAVLSLSKGRASSSMEPLKYRPAAPEVLKSFMLD
ncbi:MAG: elongation factor G [Planctomycetia bacterium]|nr:elongation factor G [Planctomycetia bacterium]